MTSAIRAIDVDVHPMPTSLKALSPYMDPFWADQVTERGMTTLDSQSWPVGAPKTIRADWRDTRGRGASTVAELQRQCLDPFNVEIAILNPLFGVQLLFS